MSEEAMDKETLTAINLVDNLIKSVRKDIRMGLMLSLDDNSMATLIRHKRSEAKELIEHRRGELIDALLYGVRVD